MEHTNHSHYHGLTVIEVLKINKKIQIAVGIVAIATILTVFYLFKNNFIIAATVDGRVISRYSLIKELERQNGKTVLDTMISENIIANEASKKGIVVTDSDIDQEVKVVESGILAQGGTLDMALLQQGMTVDDLKDRIRTQKMVEKLLADKIVVSEAEVNTYIATNKISLPKGKETEAKTQIADQLRDQKLNQEAKKWIAELKSSAKVKYYIKY